VHQNGKAPLEVAELEVPEADVLDEYQPSASSRVLPRRNQIEREAASPKPPSPVQPAWDLDAYSGDVDQDSGDSDQGSERSEAGGLIVEEVIGIVKREVCFPSGARRRF
jgi:hypothetical protein